MQAMRTLVPVILAGLGCAGAARTNLRRSGSASGLSLARSGLTETGRMSLEATFGHVMRTVLHHGTAPSHEVDKVMKKMSVSDAMQRLDGQLPEDVVSLVHLSTAAGSSGKAAGGSFDETSLEKARVILNDMIYRSWLELDKVVTECKEFELRNRMTFDQVRTDLANYAMELSKLQEVRVQAGEGINQMDRRFKENEDERSKETQSFKEERAVDDEDLKQKKSDLAVFDFLLQLTQCPSSLLQLSKGLRGGAQTQSPQICSGKDGISFHFDNPVLQAKVEQMMTPAAKRALREALGEVDPVRGGGAKGAVGFRNLQLLQLANASATSAEGEQLGNASARDPNSTAAVFLQLGQAPGDSSSADENADGAGYQEGAVPVRTNPRKGQWKKCTDGTYDCGLLHDLMSMQWGKFQDAYDYLKDVMSEKQRRYDETMALLNEQLIMINDQKTQHMENLAESISEIQANREANDEKTEQRIALDAAFEEKMEECHSKVAEIFFTDMCAVRKVRNQVLRFSTVSPPSLIRDCDLTDWKMQGDCQDNQGRLLMCDDSCPKQDPYKCGGWAQDTRERVTWPNDKGIQCPPLARLRKCNQRKCPVDCQLSQWGGWSACTSECDGGSQEQTRAVITKPRNGGQFCDTIQEERNCHTFSCYRDCRLGPWTQWSSCSMACSLDGMSGTRTRVKQVVVPIRGNGKCPSKRNRKRYQVGSCNHKTCAGDEICIAKQDLIIALDASGSLRQEGFNVLRDFAANLTGRYKGEYFGREAMRVGVVLFGNGVVETQADGTSTISPATNLIALTADMATVKTTIEAATWQKGFTNMAQAFSMADVMLQNAGRGDAQSAVLVISDGKYSFEYQTRLEAKQLKDKNVQLFMAPVSDSRNNKELSMLRRWASKPSRASYDRIPGLEALEYNLDMFSNRLVAKFCPRSISMKLLIYQEDLRKYMLLGWMSLPDSNCLGNPSYTYLGRMRSKTSCALEARKRSIPAFVYGRHRWTRRVCYGASMTFDEAQWDAWQADRRAPSCPGGAWHRSPYYNTYVLKPAT